MVLLVYRSIFNGFKNRPIFSLRVSSHFFININFTIHNKNGKCIKEFQKMGRWATLPDLNASDLAGVSVLATNLELPASSTTWVLSSWRRQQRSFRPPGAVAAHLFQYRSSAITKSSPTITIRTQHAVK
jgi:hypothetical protein